MKRIETISIINYYKDIRNALNENAKVHIHGDLYSNITQILQFRQFGM